MGGMICERGRF